MQAGCSGVLREQDVEIAPLVELFEQLREQD